MFSRRQFLRNSVLAGGLGLVPRPLWASADTQAGQKFLFVFAAGGWDPTWVFAPMFGSASIDMPIDSDVATVGGLSYVDGGGRPNVRAFFERYASRSAILNGFEVRSVTHERCRRLLLTGSSDASADDWPSMLAGAVPGYALPYLVVSGPAYTANYTTSVMRLGETGQLSTLLDSSALSTIDQRVSALGAPAKSSVDSYLQQRRAVVAAAASDPRAQRFMADLETAAAQEALVRSLPDLDLSVQLSGITPISERVRPALACFEGGYSRCAIVAHEGQYETTWDNHSNINQQAYHYDLLFQDLLVIMDELERRRGVSGQPLSEEVTLVVCSEMGRGPKMNVTGGKDHWTFTSALLVGHRVRGGQVFGGYTDSLLGQPVDMESGLPDAGGVLLSSGNFGATLLAMADIDPGVEQPVLGMIA